MVEGGGGGGGEGRRGAGNREGRREGGEMGLGPWVESWALQIS